MCEENCLVEVEDSGTTYGRLIKAKAAFGTLSAQLLCFVAVKLTWDPFTEMFLCAKRSLPSPELLCRRRGDFPRRGCSRGPLGRPRSLPQLPHAHPRHGDLLQVLVPPLQGQALVRPEPPNDFGMSQAVPVVGTAADFEAQGSVPAQDGGVATQRWPRVEGGGKLEVGLAELEGKSEDFQSLGDDPVTCRR